MRNPSLYQHFLRPHITRPCMHLCTHVCVCVCVRARAPLPCNACWQVTNANFYTYDALQITKDSLVVTQVLPGRARTHSLMCHHPTLSFSPANTPLPSLLQFAANVAIRPVELTQIGSGFGVLVVPLMLPDVAACPVSASAIFSVHPPPSTLHPSKASCRQIPPPNGQWPTDKHSLRARAAPCRDGDLPGAQLPMQLSSVQSRTDSRRRLGPCSPRRPLPPPRFLIQVTSLLLVFLYTSSVYHLPSTLNPLP